MKYLDIYPFMEYSYLVDFLFILIKIYNKYEIIDIFYSDSFCLLF